MSQFHAPGKQTMATKLNIITCLQQAKGLAEIAYRCPASRSLCQLTLRAPASQPAARPGLKVSIETQNPHDKPSPVSIVHAREPAPVRKLSA